MAIVTQNLLKINNAYIIDYVYSSFTALAKGLRDDKGLDIGVYQSYMSEYAIVDELRQLHKDKQRLYPDLTIVQLVNTGKYEEVKQVVETSSDTDFYPPLSRPYDYFESSNRRLGNQPTSQVIFPIPARPKEDPRSTGKLVIPTPLNIFKYPDTYQWLLNNSFRYGFVIYLDIGLLWEGYESIERRFRSKQSKEEIIGRYLKHSDLLDFTHKNLSYINELIAVNSSGPTESAVVDNAPTDSEPNEDPSVQATDS